MIRRMPCCQADCARTRLLHIGDIHTAAAAALFHRFNATEIPGGYIGSGAAKIADNGDVSQLTFATFCHGPEKVPWQCWHLVVVVSVFWNAPFSTWVSQCWLIGCIYEVTEEVRNHQTSFDIFCVSFFGAVGPFVCFWSVRGGGLMVNRRLLGVPSGDSPLVIILTFMWILNQNEKGGTIEKIHISSISTLEEVSF